MKKSCLTVVLTLICLLAWGGSARAQDADKVVTNVPFEFVAGGRTLPAGTYSVSRVHSQETSGLVILGRDNGAFLLPIVFVGAPAEHAKLSFEHVGDKYFLSKVETAAGVYTIGTRRAMTKLAQTEDHGDVSSAGTN
jgi:hypothetical protein